MTATLRAKGQALDARDVVLAGSAGVLALSSHAHLPLLLIGIVFVAAMATRPARLRQPRWWLAAAAACFVVDATRFLALDDHIVLTHYWVLAIGLSLLSSDPDLNLERNGRLLIGLTMGLAVASKIHWGEFVDGSFFEATVLLDDRFSWLARVAGIDDPSANHAAFTELATTGGPVALQTGPRLGPLVWLLTTGTILVEAGVAIAYLLPSRWRWLPELRSTLLAVFCVVTYAIVPVAGFGGILLVMAAADRRFDRTGRLRHLAGAAALYAWGIVWTALH